MNPRTITSSLLRRRILSGGFTLPELILGIAITAIIGSSCAAIALSVSTGWKHADSSNAEYLTKGRTSLYVQSKLRGAKTLGFVRSGSLESPGSGVAAATVLFWRADLNDDQKIQIKEVALLQHSVAASQLLLYEASASIEGTAANRTISAADLAVASAPEDFKANAYVSARIAGRGVVGARFDAINTDSGAQRPSVEFLLKLNLGETGVSYEYGSATLRPPR